MRPILHILPLVTVLACNGNKTEPEDTGSIDTEDTGVEDTDTEDTEDTSDTSDTEDTEDPDTGIETPIPFGQKDRLFQIEAQDGTDGLIALSGVVLSLDGPLAGWFSGIQVQR